MSGITGIDGIGGMLMIKRSTPSQLPSFQFELKSISWGPRSIEDRQLSFIFDDTTKVELGSMSAALQHWPGVHATVENLAIVLPTQRLIQISKAKTVHGLLGQTRFSFSRSQLANMRSLLVAGLCYATRSD
jgi:hypothetical protein